MSEDSSISFPLPYALNRAFDQRKWVTCARLKHIIIDVEVQSATVGNLADDRPITLFAWSLAAQVNPSPLRNPEPAHPMRGTAPYTPPRYF